MKRPTIKRPTVSEKHRIDRALIQGKQILEQKRASATNRKKKDEDSERIDAFNRLLRSYAEILPAQVILLAIKMYKQGKSYDEVKRYLEYEKRREESLGKVNYYGGRTLREARQEHEDDELELW